MQFSPPFRMSMANLRYGVEILSNILKQHSAPFWSPRYSAHMCMDTSMPASLAYFMTMLYNPNNVAIEASPITTELELRAGRQLCRMLGYKASEDISFPNYNGAQGCSTKSGTRRMVLRSQKRGATSPVMEQLPIWSQFGNTNLLLYFFTLNSRC